MRKTLAAFIIAATCTFLTYSAAVSQMKAPAPVVKVLLDNATVHVTQSTYAPGAVSPMTKRQHALIYVIAGPQHIKRTDADGHTKTDSYPTGAAHFEEGSPMRSLTNVGSNTYRVLAVTLKN